MATRRKKPPRYLRVQFVLSDLDYDLKSWCWENHEATGRVIRDALRAWLDGQLEAVTPPPAPQVQREPAKPPMKKPSTDSRPDAREADKKAAGNKQEDRHETAAETAQPVEAADEEEAESLKSLKRLLGNNAEFS